MRDSAFGPPAIPPDLWSRPEVTAALGRRDIGELFRLLKALAGMSQTRIGAATGNAQGRVSEIISGKYEVRTVTSLDRIAQGLDMPDYARVALGLAPANLAQRPLPRCFPTASTRPRDCGPVPGHDRRGGDGEHPPVAGRCGPRTRADLSAARACRLDVGRAGLARQ